MSKFPRVCSAVCTPSSWQTSVGNIPLGSAACNIEERTARRGSATVAHRWPQCRLQTPFPEVAGSNGVETLKLRVPASKQLCVNGKSAGSKC